MTNHDPKSPAARGLSAIMKGAAGHPDQMERDMQRIINERRGRPMSLDDAIPTAEVPRPPPISSALRASEPRPLSPEAETLIRKGITLPAEQMQREANEATAQILSEAQELVDEVARWGLALMNNAQETAARIAEEHAALRRARAHFQRAMGEEGQPTQSTQPKTLDDFIAESGEPE